MDQKNYPCQSCGAKLEFAPGAALKCPYCGYENAIAKSEEEIEELDFASFLKEASQKEETVSEQTVRCGACGAQSVVDPKISMSHCAFCGSTLNAQAKTSRSIKPKSLLPFKVKRQEATDRFKKWLGSLWFAPGNLKKYARADNSLKGVYIPYWTFDSKTTSFYRGERGEDYQETEQYTTKDASGKTVTKTRQVTKTRWYAASGVVGRVFDDVLAMASESLPRAIADRLEPWPLAELTPYQDEFVSGLQCEAYQVDLAKGFDLAKKVMESQIERDVKADIGGDRQRVSSIKTQYNKISFKHVLLPIWISAYRYGAKSYRFLVNGATGEVQGDRPFSAIKIAMLVVGIVVGGVILYMLLGR